ALAPGDAVAVATFEVARDAEASPGAPGDAVTLEATRLGVLRAVVAPAPARAAR
ncbi:MAG: hypothetical protein AVDCRST_MAG11-2680, partial [uncultured Gemmatimonadaceae bacterium]